MLTGASPISKRTMALGPASEALSGDEIKSWVILAAVGLAFVLAVVCLCIAFFKSDE